MKSIQSLLALGCLLVSLAGYGQTRNNSDDYYKGKPFGERLFFGGDLGASFGNITFVRVAPLVGYNVSERFAVGLGPSYQYYRDRTVVPDFETSIYGGSTFARYFVLNELFLQTEFELLNLEEIDYSPTLNEFRRQRVNVPIWMVGGGYSQRIRGGAGFFVAILYDLIQDRNSPYPNNIIFRIGGTFGF
jgi:hypothetical protein